MIQTENSVHVQVSGSLVSISSHNSYILRDPGAASWDGAIFLGKSLFEGQKSPWELTLTEPVQEMFPFVLLIGQKNIFLGSP